MQTNLLYETFPALKSLDCSVLVGPSEEQLQHIASISDLQSLTVRGNYATGNSSLAVIADLLKLTELNFEDAKSVVDSGLSALSGLHSLQKISLKGTDGIKGDGLTVLQHCSQLKVDRPNDLDSTCIPTSSLVIQLKIYLFLRSGSLQ